MKRLTIINAIITIVILTCVFLGFIGYNLFFVLTAAMIISSGKDILHIFDKPEVLELNYDKYYYKTQKVFVLKDVRV
jgi:hypothetical protein